MHSHTPDDGCPVCGKEYDQRIVLKGSVDWRDVYPGRPRSFFRKYNRRCSSKIDTETDDNEQVGHDEVAVYFHDDGGPQANLL